MSIILKDSEFMQQYAQYLIQNTDEFTQHCISKYPKLDPQTVKDTSALLMNYNSVQLLSFPVVTFRMGLGKTTLLNEFVQYKLQTQPNYAAIISVERIETIKTLCERYPNYYGVYGFTPQECLEKYTAYNPNLCRICTHKECRVKQNSQRIQESRVIVITHTRLHMMMNDPTLMNKYMFYTDFARKIKRSDLFIDESPGFYMTVPVKPHQLKIFQYALHQSYRIDCKSRRQLIQYFEPYIEELKEELVQNGEHRIHNPLINLVEFDEYKEKFLTNYYGSNYQDSMNVLYALSIEGIIKGYTKIVPVINTVSNLLFRTFIFDGTAVIDSTYPNDALIIDFEDKRRFINGILTIDRRYNPSKEYYDKHHNYIPEAIDKIKQELLHHEYILVITFKEFEDIYKSYFTQEELQHVYFNHFNNTKGRNDYGECTAVFILGTLYKGDEYYLGKYSGDKMNIEFINKNNQRLAYFKDTKELCTEINTFTATDQASVTLQELYRCKIRTDPLARVSLFLSSTNNQYVDLVIKELPGITVKYIDKEIKSPVQDRIIDTILQEFTKSKILKKGYIKQLCNISNDSWKLFMNNPNFLEKLMVNNIRINRYTLEKI